MVLIHKAVLGRGQIRLWDTANWQEALALHGHESFTFTVEFSPDGRQLATAGEAGTVRLWSLEHAAQLGGADASQPAASDTAKRSSTSHGGNK